MEASLQLYKEVQSMFLPTPAKCHYIFNLRDFAKVIEVRWQETIFMYLESKRTFYEVIHFRVSKRFHIPTWEIPTNLFAFGVMKCIESIMTGWLTKMIEENFSTWFIIRLWNRWAFSLLLHSYKIKIFRFEQIPSHLLKLTWARFYFHTCLEDLLLSMMNI